MTYAGGTPMATSVPLPASLSTLSWALIWSHRPLRMPTETTSSNSAPPPLRHTIPATSGADAPEEWFDG